jgi:hypothetical protein
VGHILTDFIQGFFLFPDRSLLTPQRQRGLELARRAAASNIAKLPDLLRK